MPTESAPEQLEQVWDEKISTAFHTLEPRQQKFILKYLECLNGAEAYRHAYNELAKDAVAAASASRLLTNVNVKTILTCFMDTKDEDFFLIRNTYKSAAEQAIKPIYGKDSDGQPIKIEDLPDHDTRIKGAQALAKLHGLNAPDKTETKVSGNITIASTPQDETL